MTYHISDKMSTLRPSAIREILKYTGDPSVISMAGGNPAPEALPVADMQRLLENIITDNPAQTLLYGQSEGYPPLRDELKKFVGETYGAFNPELDELIVVSGAQQNMDLVCKVLCNEGDTVICENPSFIGALNCFRSYGANLVGVPMQDDGIDLAALEAALEKNKNTRIIYTIPNFQNPSGITMSMEKRRGVYELAQKYDVMILEDNPYGDLRFAGEDIPPIKSLDTDGRVIYAGSLSKILSTGIRMAYLVAPKEIMGKMVVAKQCTDVHTSSLVQLLTLRYLTQCDIHAHIASIKGIYAHKCRLMLEEMDQKFPKSVRYTRPDGGIFIWATLPNGMDSQPFATRLVQEKKVCVVPGTAFMPVQDMKCDSFRLNFTASTDEQLVKGVGLCAELLHEILA